MKLTRKQAEQLLTEFNDVFSGDKAITPEEREALRPMLPFLDILDENNRALVFEIDSDLVATMPKEMLEGFVGSMTATQKAFDDLIEETFPSGILEASKQRNDNIKQRLRTLPQALSTACNESVKALPAVEHEALTIIARLVRSYIAKKAAAKEPEATASSPSFALDCLNGVTVAGGAIALIAGLVMMSYAIALVGLAAAAIGAVGYAANHGLFSKPTEKVVAPVTNQADTPALS